MKKEAVLNEEVKKTMEKIKRENSEKITDKPKLIKTLLHFLFGFTTGMFPESYIISPFSSAAIVTSEDGYAVFTFLGACMAFIFNRGFNAASRYIVTFVFVLASKKICEKKFLLLNRTMLSALFAAVFTLLSDVFEMILLGTSFSAVILCTADTILCACAVYFFSRSFSVPVLKIGIRRISNFDAVSLCITASCLVCCVGKINLMGFYIFHIPACLLIIFCACQGKISGGSISGILLGFVLSFGCETPELFYMYAAGGFFAGVFSFLGQQTCAAVFTAAAYVMTLTGNATTSVLPVIAECLVSSLIFMLIPSKWLSGAEEYLTKNAMRKDNEISMQVSLDLKDAARTVDSIGDVVGEVSEKINATMTPELSRTFARIQHNVCRDCESKGVCWNEYFDSTVREIRKIARLRMESPDARAENYDGLLFERCRNMKKLSDEIDRDYRQYLDSTDSRLKIDEMRSIVSDQFSVIAQLLNDLSVSVADEKQYDENRSNMIKRALRESRINAECAAYRENSFSRATVEIVISEEPGKINSGKIKRIISAELKKEFRDAEITVEDLSTILTFHQKNEYETSIGIKQIPCRGNNVCGDHAQTFDAQDGCTFAVISDGMGTGKRASFDAAMTSTIMSRLLSSGFNFKSAIGLVNSALLIKSGEESLSTVDAVCINTYNARVTFNKAGASASYIRHNGKIYTVEEPSLPVGILRNIDYSFKECQAKNGDIILMMSDGVKSPDDKWIKETLLCWSTDNMQELATHIADMAQMKNEKSFPDDITVIAIKIIKKH